MADTQIDDAYQFSDPIPGLWGPYWSDESTAVVIYISQFGNNLRFARTTDKGANWTTTQIEDGFVYQLAAWYDKETPGDSGTLLHIAWLDNVGDDAKYVSIDVSDGTVGTIRTVDAGVSIGLGGFAGHRIAITKAVNGRIIYALSTQTEIECYKSAETSAPYFAAAATDIADVFETTTEEDYVLLFPANVDAGDVCALFWDRSADEISLKMYDDSADAWTETSISGSMVDDASHINMDGAIRHSDNHLLMAAHNDAVTTTDDIKTWDLTVDSIASPTITAKTDVVTNQTESAQAAVWINQQTNQVRVGYLKGGTWEATVDLVFHISNDGMGSWGSEQAYSEATADDLRLCPAGRTVGNDGGRYQPSFFNQDTQDIFVNEVNDTEIAASGEPPATAVKDIIGTGVVVFPR